MTQELIDAPEAFFDFAQGFFQDAALYKRMDDLVRHCLRLIDRGQLSDFIAFAERAQRGAFTNPQLEERWHRSPSDYFLSGTAVRALLIRALGIAKREGADGGLYTRALKTTVDPMLEFEF